MDTPSCSSGCNPPATVAVPGSPGSNGFATVTQAFTIPAQFGNVNVSVDSTAGLIENQNVFVGSYNTDGANFLVASVNSPTSVTLEYLAFSGDLATASVIPAGQIISTGTGNLPSFASQSAVLTTANFNTPLPGAIVSISVTNTAGIIVGQQVFISGSNFLITGIGNTTTLTIQSLFFPGDTTNNGSYTINAGTVVASANGAYAVGTAGTSTTALFNAAAIGATVTVPVVSSSCFELSQNVSIDGANFLVTAIPTPTTVTLKTLGFSGDGGGLTPKAGSFIFIGTTNVTSFGISQQVTAVGTPYSLTAVSLTATTPQVVFGTTNPALTMIQAGKYLFTARVRVDQAAADWTSAAQHTVTVQMSDVTSSTVIDSSIALFKSANATATTATLVDIILIGVLTVAAADAVQLQAIIDVVPQTSGAVNIVEAVITAVRLS